MGIGVTVARLTLNQLAKVRILHTQLMVIGQLKVDVLIWIEVSNIALQKRHGLILFQKGDDLFLGEPAIHDKRRGDRDHQT